MCVLTIYCLSAANPVFIVLLAIFEHFSLAICNDVRLCRKVLEGPRRSKGLVFLVPACVAFSCSYCVGLACRKLSGAHLAFQQQDP